MSSTSDITVLTGRTASALVRFVTQPVDGDGDGGTPMIDADRDLSPEITTLADGIVRLLNGHGTRRCETRLTRAVAWLRIAAGATRFDPDAVHEALAEMRVPDDEIVDFCIPQVARQFGDAWCEDRCGFAEVTIATARLQALLIRLQPHGAEDPDGTGRTALLMTVPGDHHTLGARVAAAQLVRRGVAVRTLHAAHPDEAERALADGDYDMALISCASAHRLPAARTLCEAIHRSARPPRLVALGGLVLDFDGDLQHMTGVDIVTNDIRTALALCRARGAGQAQAAP